MWVVRTTPPRIPIPTQVAATGINDGDAPMVILCHHVPRGVCQAIHPRECPTRRGSPLPSEGCAVQFPRIGRGFSEGLTPTIGRQDKCHGTFAGTEQSDIPSFQAVSVGD